MIKLTKKQGIVLGHIMLGKTNREIAQELGVHIGTVKLHMTNIMKKYKVKNRLELLSVATMKERLAMRTQIEEANQIIISFDKLVAKLTGTVFKNVLDYYKKYGIDRWAK